MTSFARGASRVALMTFMAAFLLELVVCSSDPPTLAPTDIPGLVPTDRPTPSTTRGPTQPPTHSGESNSDCGDSTDPSTPSPNAVTLKPTTPKPTTVTPAPITNTLKPTTPKPTTVTPAPTTITPAPSTASPTASTPLDYGAARSIEKDQHLGYDVVDSGDEAADDSLDLAAVLAASLACVAVVVIGVALFYALRRKNGKAEKVSDEMIVEEDVPDDTVEMFVEAPSTM